MSVSQCNKLVALMAARLARSVAEYRGNAGLPACHDIYSHDTQYAARAGDNGNERMKCLPKVGIGHDIVYLYEVSSAWLDEWHSIERIPLIQVYGRWMSGLSRLRGIYLTLRLRLSGRVGIALIKETQLSFHRGREANERAAGTLIQ